MIAADPRSVCLQLASVVSVPHDGNPVCGGLGGPSVAILVMQLVAEA